MGDGRNPDGTLVLLGRGKVYFDRKTAASLFTGERFLGDCTALEISASVETKDRFSSCDTTGALLARALIRQTHELSIEWGEIDPQNLALQMLGEAATLVQASGAVSAEAVAAVLGVFMNRWYQLANYNMSAVTVKKGATSLTVDTDYKADLVNGRLLLIADGPGGVVEGDKTITVDYTKTPKTYEIVNAGTTGLIEGKVVFVGDAVKGPNYHIECWNVQMTPDGALGWISQDYATPKLKGALQNDATNHPTCPYYRLRKIPTS